MTLYLDDPTHGWDDWIKRGPKGPQPSMPPWLTAAGYDPNQPRGEHGRWDSAGGATKDYGPSKLPSYAQDYLHRFGVRHEQELADRIGKGLPEGLQLTDFQVGNSYGAAAFIATFGGQGQLRIEVPRAGSPDPKLTLDTIDIPTAAQGQGVAKTLLGNLADYAQEHGLTGMTLTANIDVGAYAWAKFGFVPDSGPVPVPGERASFMDDQWLGTIVPGVTARLDKVDLPPASRAAVEAALQSTDPRAIWQIVDAPGTFPLLQGTRTSEHGIDWGGHLDFNDQAAMARFHRYIGR